MSDISSFEHGFLCASDQEANRTLDQEWLLLAEVVRRAMFTEPPAPETIAEMTTTPLSETLPLQALESLTEKSARLARMSARLPTLIDFLSQEPTAEARLEPDLSNAFRQHGYFDWEYFQVARRYREARDIALLGLMGVMNSEPKPVATNQDGVELFQFQGGKGVEVAVTAEALASNSGLLDPRQWEDRQQIKDRVYRARIAGQEYIMKEHKTPRHTDTKKGGHVEGLTSREEFETAQRFAGLGVIHQGDLRLRWEKPVGYAETPNYQFAVFEPEADLLEGVGKDDPPRAALTKEIIRSKKAYMQEYKEVRTAARALYDDSERDKVLQECWGAPAPKYAPMARHLTFREFARIKAEQMIVHAQDLLTTNLTAQGYVNNDKDDFGFRIHRGERPSLEIIGFDFECYRYDPAKAQEYRGNRGGYVAGGHRAESLARRVGLRRIAAAATLVMMTEGGKYVPSEPLVF